MNKSSDSVERIFSKENFDYSLEDFGNDEPKIVSSEYLNNTEAFYNASNSTLQSDAWKEPYTSALNILLLIMLIVIMFTMGCEVKWKNVKYKFLFLISHVCFYHLSVFKKVK